MDGRATLQERQTGTSNPLCEPHQPRSQPTLTPTHAYQDPLDLCPKSQGQNSSKGDIRGLYKDDIGFSRKGGYEAFYVEL